MIVDCAHYHDGVRVAGDLSIQAAARACREPGSFVWIGLFEPSEAELEQITLHFGLHELAVEDAIKAHQRPKLELYDDMLLLVLKTARYVDSEEVVELGEILLFVGDDFIITVRHGVGSQLKGLRRALEAEPEFLRLGPSAVLHGVTDRVVDDYGPVVLGLEHDIEEVEEQVFSIDRANPTERIYYLKRETLDFHRATAPLVAPLSHLAERDYRHVHDEVREYLRDAHDHLVRVNEQVAAFRDLLTSILEANLAQISVRQNEDMRKITAWVAIAVVPTMIAGIYGMNFENMPELSSRWGYPVILGVMVAACTGLFLFFRRRGWL